MTRQPPVAARSRWGLDAIKTRGESVAIALALVGAKPFKEATGRVVKYELVPLSELKRPRIDVLASLSGIFRDSFANVVDLLDDLFETAAAAEVRKCVKTTILIKLTSEDMTCVPSWVFRLTL